MKPSILCDTRIAIIECICDYSDMITKMEVIEHEIEGATTITVTMTVCKLTNR